MLDINFVLITFCEMTNTYKILIKKPNTHKNLIVQIFE